MTTKTITAEMIARAKEMAAVGAPHYEHDDCIRIAYEWLDAQTKIARKQGDTIALKHLIERWGGRYVSSDDVQVAAILHSDIRGDYPHYNISSKLVRPLDSRLDGIGEAFTQKSKDNRGMERNHYDSVEAAS